MLFLLVDILLGSAHPVDQNSSKLAQIVSPIFDDPPFMPFFIFFSKFLGQEFHEPSHFIKHIFQRKGWTNETYAPIFNAVNEHEESANFFLNVKRNIIELASFEEVLHRRQLFHFQHGIIDKMQLFFINTFIFSLFMDTVDIQNFRFFWIDMIISPIWEFWSIGLNLGCFCLKK